MSKLDAMLPEMYRKLHEEKAFQGNSWRQHYDQMMRFLDHRAVVVLDYGCGPDGGIVTHADAGKYFRVVSYDPFVPKYAALPWDEPCDTFVSFDVFEHLTESAARDLLRLLVKREGIRRIFIALSTRAATKVFSNGANVHLTVRSADWWQGFFDGILGSSFACELSISYTLKDEAIFGYTRKK